MTSAGREAPRVANPVIERDEVAALLFNVSELVFQVTTICDLPKEDDGEEEED